MKNTGTICPELRSEEMVVWNFWGIQSSEVVLNKSFWDSPQTCAVAFQYPSYPTVFIV